MKNKEILKGLEKDYNFINENYLEISAKQYKDIVHILFCLCSNRDIKEITNDLIELLKKYKKW